LAILTPLRARTCACRRAAEAPFIGAPEGRIPDPRRRVIYDDFAPEKPPNALKTNEPEKRRNHRQKSSKVVKTGLNPLNSLKF
jgi:hypothetical protein